MKLILSKGNSKKFQNFFYKLSEDYNLDADYTNYQKILFIINNNFVNASLLGIGKHISDYNFVYFKSYFDNIEVASSIAMILDSLHIQYIDKEVGRSVSLSKLSMNTKLALNKISIPSTFAGYSAAINQGIDSGIISINKKMVLKRADADRGIDNYLVESEKEVKEIINQTPALWILQEYILNSGFYRIVVYGGKARLGIFRSLEKRPDGNKRKAHIYKPRGGINACLLTIADIPKNIVEISENSATIMNRQVAGVDVLVSNLDNKPYILEVNNNPELVNVVTFQSERRRALADYLREF